jgi:hypothetical protein
MFVVGAAYQNYLARHLPISRHRLAKNHETEAIGDAPQYVNLSCVGGVMQCGLDFVYYRNGGGHSGPASVASRALSRATIHSWMIR